MLKIHDDVWREDCVAMIGIDDDDDTVVQILPVGRDDAFEYGFDSAEEAMEERDMLVRQWDAFLSSAGK